MFAIPSNKVYRSDLGAISMIPPSYDFRLFL